MLVRRITADDAGEVATLCNQLGYTVTSAQARDHIAAVLNTPTADGFVAIDDDEVVGWIGVARNVQIQSPPYCEIRGLIVDASHRNTGIGRLLIGRAKEWAKDQGLSTLRLRCNLIRIDTHEYYRHLQFREIKDQKIFEIDI